jgi:hypothetical protein
MIRATNVIRINEREIQHIYLYRCLPAAAAFSQSTSIKSYRNTDLSKLCVWILLYFKQFLGIRRPVQADTGGLRFVKSYYFSVLWIVAGQETWSSPFSYYELTDRCVPERLNVWIIQSSYINENQNHDWTGTMLPLFVKLQGMQRQTWVTVVSQNTSDPPVIGKAKINLSLCLSGHYAMMTYGKTETYRCMSS